jgi:uncharacterized protein (DUF924 family)
MANYLPDEALEPDAREVLCFWFGEPPEYGTRLKRWFEKDPVFDSQVRKGFQQLYERLAAGGSEDWLARRADCLAYIVVLDQFPRQMFRGAARAFAADLLALRAARHAMARAYDRAMLPVERLFIYLPFEHSEAPEDQLRSCELTQPLAAFAETSDVYRYALRHRDIVQRFGRFPHRNAALGRASTPEEISFLKEPGSSF